MHPCTEKEIRKNRTSLRLQQERQVHLRMSKPDCMRERMDSTSSVRLASPWIVCFNADDATAKSVISCGSYPFIIA